MEFGWAANKAYCYSYYSYFAGIELITIEQNASRYNDAIQKLEQKTFLFYNQRAWQVVLNLMGYNEDPTILTGDVFDEDGINPTEVGPDGGVFIAKYWSDGKFMQVSSLKKDLHFRLHQQVIIMAIIMLVDILPLLV